MNINTFNNHLYDDKNDVIKYLKGGSDFGSHEFVRWYKDKDVVKVAIEKNYSAFEYLPTEMKKDYEFCLWAIKQSNACFRYVSEELKHNKEFVKEVIKIDAENLLIIPVQFKCDSDILNEVSKQKRGELLLASMVRKIPVKANKLSI